MELAQLQLVKHILETGSLSKTALRLNRAQSVVSRQLAALERECGGRIFYRNGRGVLLTELGESVLPQIDLILSAADDIVGRKSAIKNDMAGDVRLTTTPSVGSNLLGRLFTKLHQNHPNIRLCVSEGYSADIETELQEGRTDVAVFMRNGSAVGRDDHVICEFENYLVGLAGNPATRHDEISFADLEGLPLLLPSAPSPLRRALDDMAALKGIKLTVAAEVNATGPTYALLSAGAGYLITPFGPAMAGNPSMIGVDLREGRLQATRIVDPTFTRTLVVSTGVNPKQRVETVARQVVTLLRQLQDESAGAAKPAGDTVRWPLRVGEARAERKIALVSSS